MVAAAGRRRSDEGGEGSKYVTDWEDQESGAPDPDGSKPILECRVDAQLEKGTDGAED